MSRKNPRQKPRILELVMWLEHTTCWLRISCSTDWAILAGALTAWLYYHTRPEKSITILLELQTVILHGMKSTISLILLKISFWPFLCKKRTDYSDQLKVLNYQRFHAFKRLFIVTKELHEHNITQYAEYSSNSYQHFQQDFQQSQNIDIPTFFCVFLLSW